MNINEALKGLGLRPKETLIYTALLELGEATVLDISKKSDIKRPTAYLELQSLEEKGFATKIARGKKTFYAPQPPQKLVAEAEFRMKELKEVMPQLESLLQKGSGKPRVVIYEGKEKLDRAYDESFLIKGEVLYISTLKLAEAAFPRTFRKFFFKGVSPEFRVRQIMDDSDEMRAFAARYDGPYQKTRYIPREFLPFTIDVGIFGNKALISSTAKEYFTVSIESEDVANSFRTIFELMWRGAQE